MTDEGSHHPLVGSCFEDSRGTDIWSIWIITLEIFYDLVFMIVSLVSYQSLEWHSCCFSVAKSATLCNLMDCSTPDFPVLHHLLEFAQTHVHWVSDAIQPSSSVTPFSSCPQSSQSIGKGFKAAVQYVLPKLLLAHLPLSTLLHTSEAVRRVKNKKTRNVWIKQ